MSNTTPNILQIQEVLDPSSYPSSPAFGGSGMHVGINRTTQETDLADSRFEEEVVEARRYTQEPNNQEIKLVEVDHEKTAAVGFVEDTLRALGQDNPAFVGLSTGELVYESNDGSKFIKVHLGNETVVWIFTGKDQNYKRQLEIHIVTAYETLQISTNQLLWENGDGGEQATPTTPVKLVYKHVGEYDVTWYELYAGHKEDHTTLTNDGDVTRGIKTRLIEGALNGSPNSDSYALFSKTRDFLRRTVGSDGGEQQDPYGILA